MYRLAPVTMMKGGGCFNTLCLPSSQQANEWTRLAELIAVHSPSALSHPSRCSRSAYGCKHYACRFIYCIYNVHAVLAYTRACLCAVFVPAAL